MDRAYKVNPFFDQEKNLILQIWNYALYLMEIAHSQLKRPKYLCMS